MIREGNKGKGKTIEAKKSSPFLRQSHDSSTIHLTEQDESGIYHAIQLHGHICHINLKLPPPILHKVFVLLDEQFPTLEHLLLTFSATTSAKPHAIESILMSLIVTCLPIELLLNLK